MRSLAILLYYKKMGQRCEYTFRVTQPDGKTCVRHIIDNAIPQFYATHIVSISPCNLIKEVEEYTHNFYSYRWNRPSSVIFPYALSWEKGYESPALPSIRHMPSVKKSHLMVNYLDGTGKENVKPLADFAEMCKKDGHMDWAIARFLKDKHNYFYCTIACTPENVAAFFDIPTHVYRGYRGDMGQIESVFEDYYANIDGVDCEGLHCMNNTLFLTLRVETQSKKFRAYYRKTSPSTLGCLDTYLHDEIFPMWMDSDEGREAVDELMTLFMTEGVKA